MYKQAEYLLITERMKESRRFIQIVNGYLADKEDWLLTSGFSDNQTE